MKWIIFTGSWRLTNNEVEVDVREATRKVLAEGNGIITGGATGVDYFCMDECFKLKSLNKLRIIIPAKLEDFIADYRKNWCTDPINTGTIDKLSELLTKIKELNPSSILEVSTVAKGEDITQEAYNNKNSQEIMYADEICAFQVNDSVGTQDKIDKAKQSGVKVSLHKKYMI